MYIKFVSIVAAVIMTVALSACGDSDPAHKYYSDQQIDQMTAKDVVTACTGWRYWRNYSGDKYTWKETERQKRVLVRRCMQLERAITGEILHVIASDVKDTSYIEPQSTITLKNGGRFSIGYTFNIADALIEGGLMKETVKALQSGAFKKKNNKVRKKVEKFLLATYG